MRKCRWRDRQSDLQLVATKKAAEAMVHSYTHLWGVPTTMFRFFTVFGPRGGPDMALFKFADAILDGRPTDIYNGGELSRDFTYVGDLVRGTRLVVEAVPARVAEGEAVAAGDVTGGALSYLQYREWTTDGAARFH